MIFAISHWVFLDASPPLQQEKARFKLPHDRSKKPRLRKLKASEESVEHLQRNLKGYQLWIAAGQPFCPSDSWWQKRLVQ